MIIDGQIKAGLKTWCLYNNYATPFVVNSFPRHCTCIWVLYTEQSNTLSILTRMLVGLDRFYSSSQSPGIRHEQNMEVHV